MKPLLYLTVILALVGCGGANLAERQEASRADTSAALDDPAPVTSFGPICGSASIRGETIPPVPGRIAGCGIPQAVKVHEVNGVALTVPATVNCQTASALDTWVRQAVRPEVGQRGGGVASLKVAASYACRTRNHQRGARLSEHSLGNAIDISAINLRDGSALTVLRDWRSGGAEQRIMRQLHAKACGPFGTVLGPESDRFHQDHFHFDVARHRGGPYCR